MDNPSSITQERIDLLWERCELDESIETIIPEPFQRVWACPPEYFRIHAEVMENGLRIPFNKELLASIWKCKLSPAQIVPNGMGLLVALFVLLKSLGEDFTFANVMSVFTFSKAGDGSGTFYVNQRPRFQIFRSMVSSNGPKWKSNWLWLRYPEVDGERRSWGIVRRWRNTPISVSSKFTNPKNMPEWTRRFENLSPEQYLWHSEDRKSTRLNSSHAQ